MEQKTNNKNKSRKGLVIVAILSIALTAQSCAFGSDRGSGPLGVWGSENRGETWVKLNEVSVKEGKKKQSILDEVSVRDIVFSPTNSLVLYAATPNGLFGTDDAGNTWFNVLPLNITDVAVSKSDDNIIYATGTEGNRGVVYKSLNKGKDWERKYIDADSNPAVTVAINPNDHFDVFVGFASGVILNTSDGGQNWRPINTVGGNFTKMDFLPGDPRTFYILIERQGLYLTRDRGHSFILLSRTLQSRIGNAGTAINEEGDVVYLRGAEQEIPNSFLDFEFGPHDNSILYLTTDIGLYRSDNFGATWRQIRLPIDPRHAQTMAVGVTTDPNIIYVSIDAVLFRSVDGGRTFATTKVPTERLIKVIKTVPGSPDIIYTGMAN